MNRCFLAVTVALSLFLGCSPEGGELVTVEEAAGPQSRNVLRVGFSQSDTNNPWRISETISIRETAEAMGVELIFTNAEDSYTQQLKDVSFIISQDPDYIIISPKDYNGLASALQEAKTAGIPVILIDRDAAGEPGVDYRTLIVGDFVWEGKTAGKILSDHFRGEQFNLVEITGTSGASSSIFRVIGLRLAQAEHPNINIISLQTGNFVRSVAMDTMERVIQEWGTEIDAVFTHGDESGLGIIQALREAGPGFLPGQDVVVVSINGEKDAMKAVISGEMLATIGNIPRYGPITFETIQKLEAGEDVPVKIVIPGKVYDKTNAEELFHEAF